MNSRKSVRARWWLWLVGGLLVSLSLATFMYTASRTSARTPSFSDPAAHALHPSEFATMVQAAPAIDEEKLSESLVQALDHRLDEWGRRDQEASEEGRKMQARTLEEWRERLDGQVQEQFARLTVMEQKLSSLEHGIKRLLDSLEEKTTPSGMEPAFTFRGIEIWHGQAYALLEHEGRILPVRQGESRLGWRVHAIDRDHRKLHVSDGMTELILEEQ